MARLEITTGSPTKLLATFSERNLKALAHKLEMPGSARAVHNNDVWIDGHQAPYPGFVMVMSCREGEGAPEFELREDAAGGFEIWVTLPAVAIEALLAGSTPLAGENREGAALTAAVEDDETHYGAREARPGEMHPDTEAFIAGSPG